MKNWKIPGIILVLLIIAMTFRWHTEKTSFTGNSKTEVTTSPFGKPITEVIAIDNTMIKVVVDRWNGSAWEVVVAVGVPVT